MVRLAEDGRGRVNHDGKSIVSSSGFQDRGGARSERVGDRGEPAGTEHGQRDASKWSARRLGAAQAVCSTVLEWGWTADMDSLATPRMLPPGRRGFKRA